MSTDAPLSPEQLAALEALDFYTKPVQTCKVLAWHVPCLLPAMQVATKVCCGQQLEVCDAHADDFQTNDTFIRCGRCGYRARFRRLYRFASIGQRL